MTPRRIGRYRVLRTLGSGGMGTVYLAEDSQLERIIALKVLVKSAETPTNLIQRFHSEAKTAAKMRHPHIVTVFDSGEVEGYLFLALEYIEGPDLDRLIRKRGKLSVKRSLEIVRQLADALKHAHSVGVAHRDIKPSNVLLRKTGKATLSDLGLARAMGETAASNITRAGYTVGTVDYMAPEQAKSSRQADARSDLYSLGCTWFHMLTGRVPYPEGDLTNKLRAHAIGPPPDPRSIVPEIPEGIIAILNRLMAQRPDDRYQSAAQLLEDLNRPDAGRDSLSEDDLWKLTEEAAAAPHAGETSWSEDPREEPVPAGSTMVEAAGADPAPPPRTPKRRPRRASEKPNSTRSAARPAQGGQGRTLEPLASRTSGDRLRAVVVLAVLLGLLAFAIWLFANLDDWISGGPMPTPVPNAPAPRRAERVPGGLDGGSTGQAGGGLPGN